MKRVAVLSLVNAALAAASTLLAAAPLTGALLLHAIWSPMAAYFAFRKQTVAALCVPMLAVLGWALSPFRIDHASFYLLGVWAAWVSAWSAWVVYLCWADVLAAIHAWRRDDGHGA